jgi:hypothetical protein
MKRRAYNEIPAGVTIGTLLFTLFPMKEFST